VKGVWRVLRWVVEQRRGWAQALDPLAIAWQVHTGSSLYVLVAFVDILAVVVGLSFSWGAIIPVLVYGLLWRSLFQAAALDQGSEAPCPLHPLAQAFMGGLFLGGLIELVVWGYGVVFLLATGNFDVDVRYGVSAALTMIASALLVCSRLPPGMRVSTPAPREAMS